MFRDRLAETLPRKNRTRQRCRRWPHPADVDVGGKKLERVVYARAGLKEQSQVVSEDGDVLCVAAESATATPRTGAPLPNSASLRCSRRLDRDESEIFDPCD